MRAYTLTSGTFFALIAVAHVARGIAAVPIQGGNLQVPVWVSWPVAILTGALAVWAFRLARGAR